jgi:hypothetical protein
VRVKKKKQQSRRRELPVIEVVRRARVRCAEDIGLDPADLVTVELDDPLPFSCARSGNCCTGRSFHSNLIQPTEFALMFAALQEAGLARDVRDVVPDKVARVARSPKLAGIPKGQPVAGSQADVTLGEPGVRLMGLYFRMEPDAAMQDGDRCVFLLPSGTAGEHSCVWHGSRAQPTQCAMAPLAFAPVLMDLPAPRFFYPRSRFKWCAGMRDARSGLRPMTTARAIYDRNFGDERLAELRRVEAASTAGSGWQYSAGSLHSPLALLYIEALPDLEPLLEGY